MGTAHPTRLAHLSSIDGAACIGYASTPDLHLHPDGESARYPVDAFDLAFVDGSTAVFSSTSDVWLMLGHESYVDLYALVGHTPSSLTGSFAGLTDFGALFYLEDRTATALSGFPAIPDPENLPTLFDLHNAELCFGLVFWTGCDFQFALSIDTLSAPPQVVPLPGAALLGVLGLACISHPRTPCEPRR